MNATLRFHDYDYDSETQISLKTYHGKSTRLLTNTRPTKNEKEIMKREAKKVALMEFFKEHFAFTEFNDLNVDELRRPIE